MKIWLYCIFLLVCFLTVAETFDGLNDADEIIRLIKEDKRVGFLYLSPNVPKSSVKYHYYNLKYVKCWFEKSLILVCLGTSEDHCWLSWLSCAKNHLSVLLGLWLIISIKKGSLLVKCIHCANCLLSVLLGLSLVPLITIVLLSFHVI